MSSLDEKVREACLAARRAARALAPRTSKDKNAVLAAIAAGIDASSAAVLEANRRDLDAARAKGTKGAMLDRLMLDEARVAAMARSVREVADLPDPVGEVVSRTRRPSGIDVTRVRVPLGVIAMIYEARPNVTVEASALALKAGDAIVLRGGSEAEHSNAALARVIGDALESTGFPRAAVQVLPFTDREAVRALVAQAGLVDLAIPRGGEALIRFVTENARVPVVQHYKGVCHLFLDAGADVELAAKIVLNAKMSRPGVCNALECLLVDAAEAERLLVPVARALLAAGCELRGCDRTRALVPEAKAATDDDWGREFLDTVLAVRVVDGLDGALAHVADYGSGHTEAILTRDAEHAERWRREVDAACVVVNASTRFHDGGELGLGAEIGIATSRLHWRGPMGLESLTTMKWVVDGGGQTRG
ncbi:MAG: glutamate-5-semialdehyde dehydrogenase [Labilithrix sp.]|nr:glutamate-5-semialdehyde dehydrogenase [Labilithrix sp.]